MGPVRRKTLRRGRRAAATAPRLLNPAGLSVPRGYSHVADVPAGRTVYVSGQVAFDAEGNVVGKGDFRAQAERVFRNLKTALECVGASFADLVKITIYVRDMSQLTTLQDVRESYLGSGPRPASTLVEVNALVHPDLLLEIEAVAAPGPRFVNADAIA